MTPILELRNVSKRFGGLAAVKNVSFTMNEGEIVFVIGPNGAGKTTVFNLVSGFLHPNEGTILFEGQEITKSAPHDTARRGVGRTFQIVKPLPSLTVLQKCGSCGIFRRADCRSQRSSGWRLPAR